MKRWEILYSEDTQNPSLDVKDIISILLLNRGITDKDALERFLHPDLSSVTPERVHLDKKAIKKAITRIQKSIDKEKTIVVYGDYDVDGICGTAILWEGLYSMYKKAVPFIPTRSDEGYGISIAGIDHVLGKYPDTDLIITVDNGIVAHEAISYAKSKEIDVIVTDHHVPGDPLTDSFAIIHTTLLCGAGVAYLFVKEILSDKKLGKKFLDLVALATVADLVPLVENNRTLLYFGLDVLKTTDRCGLQELFKESGIDNANIGTYEIGHVIAPRLNATGRLSSALDSLRLVCTKDPMRAKNLAQVLANSNKERQTLTHDLSSHAINISETMVDGKKIIVVAHESYNQGVIGLIASRLVERFYRPTLVISMGETYSKGSARSVRGVNIIELIRSVSDHVVQAGGHPMAAGFTLETAKIEAFRTALEEKAIDTILDEHLTRTVAIDMELPWESITHSLYKAVQELAPFGIGNAEPTFTTKSVYVAEVRTMGKNNSHYKLLLEKDGKIMEAVAFGMVESIALDVNDEIDIAYTIDFDTWRGKNKVCLKLKDIQKTSNN